MSQVNLSDRALSIEPSLTLQISAKANQLSAEGVDICNLSAGEPDFDAPKEVIEATSKAIFDGFTKYGPAAGNLDLRKAIANKLQIQNDLNYEFENVMVTNGAKQAIYNLFQVLLNTGDEVIIPSPYWLSYPQMVRLAGGKPIFTNSSAEDGFKINIEDLKSKISSKTKFIIINSPNNPTGRVMSKEELLQIADLARENPNINILSDEIYELILKKEFKHYSLSSLANDLKDRIFIINGFAKGWAMTGWRIGYLVGPKDVIKASSALQSQSTSNVCSFVQKGALEALKINNEFFSMINSHYDQRRRLLYEGLNNINGIYIEEPNGAFSSLLFSVFSSPVFSNPKVLKVGAIPDQNQDVLDKRFNLFSKELSKQLDVEVKYIPVINYVAAVTGFRTKDLDLVWFGGLSGVQARLQTPNSIVIAQRDIDKEFKSVFIVNKNLELNSISNIKGLKKLKNLRFTFGSENSTSGRLMPEYFLNQAGVEIKHFKGKKAGFSGSHDATIALVNSGAFDAGALNKQVWENNLKNNPKRTSNLELFWITPEYVDYHWVAQGDLENRFGEGFTKELKSVILNLDIKQKSHKQILDMFNAKRFIKAESKQYKNIEEIGRKLNKIR